MKEKENGLYCAETETGQYGRIYGGVSDSTGDIERFSV